MAQRAAFIPRQLRIGDLTRRTFERYRAAGAIEAGIASIRAAFGHNRIINDRKLAVESAMHRGAGAILTRHYYGEIAFACPPHVGGALIAVNRLLRDEVADCKRRQRGGFPIRHPEIENRLHEARLFLRWHRRFGDHARFAAIIDALTTSTVYAVELSPSERLAAMADHARDYRKQGETV